MADRSVTFDILARDRASGTLEKVGGKFSGLGRVAGTVGKGIALAAGGVALGGIAALSAGLAQGVRDAANYQTLAAKTAAVLKSTGNAAGTSVEHIQELAGSLESLSGVDEELIINSQNVLATFTGIQNKVGKGNDVFDQATKAALNMSSALGTDLQGSSIQVGKALNNPIKGVTALSKVGVSFTDQQKKQIKTLQESGDTLGAQKIILAELSKEFGGAAEAAGSGFNGQMAKLKDTVGDFGREVGTALLPHLTKLFKWLNEKLPGAIKWVSDSFKKLRDGFGLTGNQAAGFGGKIDKLVKFGQKLRQGWDALVSAGKKLSDWFTGKLVPAVKSAVQDALPKLREALGTLKKTFSGSAGDGKKWGDLIVTVVTKVIAIAAYMAPIVADHIQRIVVGIKVLWTVFKKTANIALDMADGVLTAVAFIIGAMAKIPGKVGQPFRDALPGIRSAKKELKAVKDAINGIPSDKNITVRVNGKKVGFNPKTGRATINNKFIPIMGNGGPVAAGGSYVVGDNGPELFSPSTNGTIIPNHAMGGGQARAAGGGGDTFIINASSIEEHRLGQVVVNAIKSARNSGRLTGVLT